MLSISSGDEDSTSKEHHRGASMGDSGGRAGTSGRVGGSGKDDDSVWDGDEPDCWKRVDEAKMDWQGQKVAEQLMQILLLAFAVVGFLIGYVLGSFQMMMLVYAGGVVLTTLVTVPNWPFFNRHPLKWLDPSEAEKHPKPQRQQAVNSKKKSAKK